MEKILQLLVWSSDTVYLPRHARLDDSLPTDLRDSLADELAQYAEAGLIKTYAFEGNERLTTTRAAVLPDANSTTIPFETHRDLAAQVRDATYRYRDVLRGSSRPGHRLEGMTEYVTLQSHLWTLSVAGALGLGQTSASESRSDLFARQIVKSNQTADRWQPAVESLMQLEQIDALTGLDLPQILDLRKHLPHIRGFLLATAREVALRNPIAPAETLDDLVAQEALRNYVGLLQEYGMSSKASDASAAASLSVTIAGVLFPALAILSFAEPIAQWLLDKTDRRGVVTFAIKLRKYTH